MDAQRKAGSSVNVIPGAVIICDEGALFLFCTYLISQQIIKLHLVVTLNGKTSL